ncbi:MAG: hypothetical protein VX278_13970 [Myxococcota bacterium]|nr:hypothetical protein [Myxococcota bacterium]
MYWLLCFGLFGCNSPAEKTKPALDTATPDVVSFHDTERKPSLHISNSFPKQQKMIVDAYKQNIAYYQSISSKEVVQVRFVGMNKPWKPEAERHYCIDVPLRQAIDGGSEQEDVYYFANYCRSLSTLFREADRIFKSYIDFEDCTDICNCALENHLEVIPKNARSCERYCEDMTWEQFCSSSADLERQCCL